MVVVVSLPSVFFFFFLPFPPSFRVKFPFHFLHDFRCSSSIPVGGTPFTTCETLFAANQFCANFSRKNLSEIEKKKKKWGYIGGNREKYGWRKIERVKNKKKVVLYQQCKTFLTLLKNWNIKSHRSAKKGLLVELLLQQKSRKKKEEKLHYFLATGKYWKMNTVGVTPNRQSAVVSICFHTGLPVFRSTSTQHL